jgi:DNA-binding FrmR family transcriptional regulator
MSCDKKIKNRIQRSKGQMNGVLQMLEDDKSCHDVLIQLMAIRSSIDKTIGHIITENITQILNEKNIDATDERIQEALSMIIKTK